MPAVLLAGSTLVVGWLLGLKHSSSKVKSARAERQDEVEALQELIALERVRTHKPVKKSVATMDWLSKLPDAHMRRPARSSTEPAVND